MNSDIVNNDNPLGSAPIGKLMVKFALPSIVAMLVGALYNIVDQLFIGQAVGTNGNAATNIAFPLSMLCTSLALLFGIGGASTFNLTMGKGEKEKAPYYIGNSIVLLAGSGIILSLITIIFLTPLLKFFGSPDEVLPYAKSYVGITAFGFPFLLMTIGGGHLIRADGSPKMTMICNLLGAVINTILDAVFVFGFHMGMEGAALATVIGQFISGTVAIIYFTRYKTVKLSWKHLKIKPGYTGRICMIGMASCFNQIAMMIVQIVLNKSLKYYGSLSEYGESIPIACVGIITKVSQVYFSIVIGISQGSQPIESFNYGAGNYKRVKKAFWYAVCAAGTVSIIAYILFQIFPGQIISLFGKGSDAYYKFGIKYFRIYLFLTFVNFLQPLVATFFTSIGKSYKGIFLSLTRQIIFLLPMIVILPLLMGIDGICYAGPIADLLAAVVAVIMCRFEFLNMNKLSMENMEQVKM